MKTNKLLLMIPFFLLILDGGCEKNNDLFWEISPGSEIQDINYKENGINIHFCLLNEEGESTTSFSVKENIIFSFSIENNSDNNISIPTDFIDSTFYRVYEKYENTDLGKPWSGLWCEYSMTDKRIELVPSGTKHLNCPWILIDGQQPDYPLCMSESKDYLPIGEYYTAIQLKFKYYQEKELKTIDNVVFKINFKIQ